MSLSVKFIGENLHLDKRAELLHRAKEVFNVESVLFEEQSQQVENMMQWFQFSHLPPRLQEASIPFHDLALFVCQICQPGPERTVALRKLLEAKDAAVRARLNPGS